MVKLTSVTGGITVEAKLWEGVRAGTIAKCYESRVTGLVAGSLQRITISLSPRGGNNNEILPDDCDRLSGATARNGGFTGVKIEKRLNLRRRDKTWLINRNN